MTREEKIEELEKYCANFENCKGCELDFDGQIDCNFTEMDDVELYDVYKRLIDINLGTYKNAVDEGCNTELAPNMINHPSHYNQGGIECIDTIKAATVGKVGIEAFCVGNAIKYLFRYEEKNGIEDVEKAKWYIDRLIKELKSRDDK